MVLTRRRKERSNVSEQKAERRVNEGRAGPVSEKDEQSDQSSDHSSSKEGAREPVSTVEEAAEDVSNLFVLDNTGNEGPGPTAENGMQNKRTRNRRTTKLTEGNALTKLLPGYTAPMQLNTSSLDKYRPTGGIKALQRQAERSDVSTKCFVNEATKEHAQIMQTKTIDLSTSKYVNAYASFKKGVKRTPETTAGSGWFNMRPTPMSEELKADLAVIRNRNYLDPKKFYKSADKFSNVVQVGTVIEGSAEFFSSRLTKKQRRSNITEEIMADPASADYARNKFRSMAQEKTREAQKRLKVHRPKRGKRGF